MTEAVSPRDWQVCSWCREPFTPQDALYDWTNGPRMHKACSLRMVIGSVAHVEQRCSCYVRGSTEGDPPGLTTRAAAEAALRAFLTREVCEGG